ncbi:MAG: L-seryl-tRNA(Sec) selenium transferase [Chloroflexi bacterium]|nr:L-seryl-tRNA(Sec) selenium transferase [Chloroflexota bacterium]
MNLDAGTGTDHRRALPSVDRLLQSEAGRILLETYPHQSVVDALRQSLTEARFGSGRGDLSENGLVATGRHILESRYLPSLRPAINGTGVILHTNLGRAPLSARARQDIEQVARSYSTLEYNLDAGARGTRHEHVTGLLQRLTGAEDGLVVNNNASAILLALSATATGKEVLISRGQLVEIGGGFRIPDVLRQSGARLVEVGTTNRTYAEDYAAAIGEDTAVLLRVHTSNFRLSGFVHTASLGELVELGRGRHLSVLDDLGSGSLLPTESYGLAHEPMVQESVAAGADLVCFSGDKLIGGPQAGIIVGKTDIVDRLRRHPLTRALRPDKATLAALYATLIAYELGAAEREIPVWRMISLPVAELEHRGQVMLTELNSRQASVVPSQTTIGGGSLPGETLDSRAIALRPVAGSAQQLAGELRHSEPPLIGHIEDDRVLLDLRTIAPDEDATVCRIVADLLVPHATSSL